MKVKKITLGRLLPAAIVLLLTVAITMARQTGVSEEAGRVTALENVWNRAMQAKDMKALDTMLADSLVAVDIDGSTSNKAEYLASLGAPDFQITQAVNEQMKVQVYGDTAIAVGMFRIRGTEKNKPYVHRERTIDTWVKTNGVWKCVAAVAVEIPAKSASD